MALLSGQIGWYNAQSTGVQSSPVQSTGLSLDSKPLFRVQSQSSGLRVQSESTGLDINTLSGVTSVLIVINYNKKAKIGYILNRIKSLTIL